MTSRHRIEGLRVDVPTREPDAVLLEQLHQLSTASVRGERRAYPKVLAAFASVAALAATTWLAGAVPGTTSPLVPPHHRQDLSRTVSPSPSPAPSGSSPDAVPTAGVAPGSGVVPRTTPGPDGSSSTTPGRSASARPTPSSRPQTSNGPRRPHGTPPGQTSTHGKRPATAHPKPHPGTGSATVPPLHGTSGSSHGGQGQGGSRTQGHAPT